MENYIEEFRIGRKRRRRRPDYKRERDNARRERDDARRKTTETRQNFKKYRDSIPRKIAAATAAAAVATQTRLSNTFSKYLVIKNRYFNKQAGIVQGSFDALLNKTTAEIDDLMKQVQKENGQLKKQIAYNNSTKNESKYVKSDYQNIETEKLKSQNKILLFIFYCLVLILGGLMVLYKTMNIKIQMIIIVILIIYPFIIYYIEAFFYYIFSYLKSFFESTPFSNAYLYS